jgi:two-component system, NtrC family, response regulator AtoC
VSGTKVGLDTTPLAKDGDRPLDAAQRVYLFLSHRDGAQVVELLAGVSVVVGRLPPSDVIVPDSNLSRQHARFTLERDEVVVEDLGSTNGTQVGGEDVERCVLHPGTDVLLGAVTARLHLVAAEQGVFGGVDGHDRFRARLDAEVERARYFHRSAALLMLRGARPGDGDPQRCFPRLRQHLRSIDAAGLYGPDTFELLFPEIDAARALELAKALTQPMDDGGGLLAGVAVFPDAGSTGEELLQLAKEALRAAGRDRPVSCAPARGPWVVEPGEGEDDEIVRASEPMRAILETARRLAKGTIPVVLEGETGTGKEVIARFIHRNGPRAKKPMVCVNCGAVPQQLVESTLFGHERGAFTGAIQQHKGVFEAASGGTLFLDELGELAPPAQAALLRVLETKHFTRIGGTKEIAADVRIIAASHRELDRMVADGRFRQDLLYRLNAMVLKIPPLRARREDIAPLAQRFLGDVNRGASRAVTSFEPAALELIMGHAWPGNVRELRNAVERAVTLAHGDVVTIDDLPDAVRTGVAAPHGASSVTLPPPESDDDDFRALVERYEIHLLRHALENSGWNQTHAARRLKMPVRTLVYKIRAYRIRPP